MKKIIAIIVIVVLVSVSSVAFLSNHLVRVEQNYSYDNGIKNHFTGKTVLHVDTIETKLFTGEIISQSSDEVEVEFTAEMMVFNNHYTRTKIEFR